MNTSLSWIKAYVPELDVTAQEYTDAMTLSGTKVEGYEELDADLDKIVVGQIDKIEKHPDADKLIICQVNVGAETVQIVTGAPNVKEGDKVPVVLDGGRVAGGHDGKMTPGGIRIKAGKLRGVPSNGRIEGEYGKEQTGTGGCDSQQKPSGAEEKVSGTQGTLPPADCQRGRV